MVSTLCDLLYCVSAWHSRCRLRVVPCTLGAEDVREGEKARERRGAKTRGTCAAPSRGTRLVLCHPL
eukprot:6183175-Pleurochrysis_carterae.AAC.2